MLKRTILFLISSLLFAAVLIADDADALSNSADALSDTINAQKKSFSLSGAIETKNGDKFLLRRKSSHIEFLINNDTEIYTKESASADKVEDGYFVLIKGPKNKNTILANSIYIFKDWETYKATKEQDTDNKKTKYKRVFSGVLRGTVIKKWSDSDELEKLQEQIDNAGKTDAQIKEEAEQKAEEEAEAKAEAEANGEEYKGDEEKAQEEEKRYRSRPFYIKNADGKVYKVGHDEDTYWVLTNKAGKNDIKIGDRATIFFGKRVTIRYDDYAEKIIVNKAKAGY